MAINAELSDITAATSLAGGELIYIVQGGNSRRLVLGNGVAKVLDDTGETAILRTLGGGTTGIAVLRDTGASGVRGDIGITEMVQVTWYGTVDKTGATSSQTTVAAAVADANTNGYDLYWPAGTYLTTASIANFHDVRHFGPGVVKRGTDEFRVQPKSSHSNTLYFSAAGLSTNDGISSSEPKTFQTALDALANYGPTLNGSWTLKGAAGTYTNGAVDVPDINTAGNRVLKIQGPAVSVTAGASVCFIINGVSGTFQAAETITGGTSGFTATVTAVTDRKLVATMVSGTPSADETITGGTSGATATINAAVAVPTLLMDGTSTTSIGMKIYGRQSVEIEDIKFKGYTSRGINANGNNLISLKNVHDEDNFFGIVVNGFGAQYFVSGGVWEKSASYAPSGTFARIQSFFGAKHHIGYSYDETTGNPTQDSTIADAPQLICAGSASGARGIWVAENATGHVFARVTDFFKGIEVVSASRVHLDGDSAIQRNTWGVEWRHGCDTQIDTGVEFGAGTANENTSENRRILGGVDSINTHAFARSMMMVGEDLTTRTHTATTVETQLGGTLYTLSGDDFKTTGSLRMRVLGTITGADNSKTLRMRVGGSSIASVTWVAAANGGFIAELGANVKGNDSQTSLGWGIAGDVSGTAGSADASGADLTQTWGDGTDRAVTLHATLADTGDVIAVKAVELWRIG